MERQRWIPCLSQVLLIIFFGPLAAAAHFEEVHVLIEAGEYTEAIEKLEALSESAQDIAVKSWCYYQIGEIYYNNTHQYTQAVGAYDRILGLADQGLAEEELFLAIIKKGDVYSRLGNYREAIETYDRLIHLAPATHFVHKTGLEKIRDIQRALSELRERRRVLVDHEETPLAALARFEIAELYRNPSQLNQPAKAIAMYEELLAAHPDAVMAPEARWRVGQLRARVFGESGLAIATYRKVVKEYPASNFAAEALFQIATLHRMGEKYALAVPVFEKLKRNYPNFWNMHAVLYWTGVCYEKLLNYPKAIEAFKTFLHVYLPHLDPAYLGQISMHDKNVAEVRTQIGRKIEKLTQQVSAVEAERLDTARADRDFNEALGIARSLIAMAPDTVHAKRASAQVSKLQHLSAIENLRDRLHGGALPRREAARARLQIGTIYEQQLQDDVKALEAYEGVSKDYPDLTYAAEALYRSGRIYAERLAAPQEALTAYKGVIAAHPNTLQAMMAHFQCGELYRKGGQPQEALAAYKRVGGYPERARYMAGGHTDSFSDRAAFRMGRVYYAEGRYTEARFAFEAFIENRGESPRLSAAYMYLAAINEKRGEKAQATYFYKRAEELLTDNSVQMASLLEEAGNLGTLPATDSDTVMRFLKAHQKRLKTR